MTEFESGPAHQDRASDTFGDPKAEFLESEMRAAFAVAVDKADANALAVWAPKVTDWDTFEHLRALGKECTTYHKRTQTLAECMAEPMEYGYGPDMSEAMQLILNARLSGDVNLAKMAANLLERMGASFARNNS